MKRKYIIPTVEVINIEAQQMLLAGSGGFSFNADGSSGTGSLGNDDEYADGDAW